MTGHQIKIDGYRIDKKTGEMVRTYKLAAGQRKNVYAKASRQEKKWKDKLESKT